MSRKCVKQFCIKSLEEGDALGLTENPKQNENDLDSFRPTWRREESYFGLKLWWLDAEFLGGNNKWSNTKQWLEPGDLVYHRTIAHVGYYGREQLHNTQTCKFEYATPDIMLEWGYHWAMVIGVDKKKRSYEYRLSFFDDRIWDTTAKINELCLIDRSRHEYKQKQTERTTTEPQRHTTAGVFVILSKGVNNTDPSKKENANGF